MSEWGGREGGSIPSRMDLGGLGLVLTGATPVFSQRASPKRKKAAAAIRQPALLQQQQQQQRRHAHGNHPRSKRRTNALAAAGQAMLTRSYTEQSRVGANAYAGSSALNAVTRMDYRSSEGVGGGLYRSSPRHSGGQRGFDNGGRALSFHANAFSNSSNNNNNSATTSDSIAMLQLSSSYGSPLYQHDSLSQLSGQKSPVREAFIAERAPNGSGRQSPSNTKFHGSGSSRTGRHSRDGSPCQLLDARGSNLAGLRRAAASEHMKQVQLHAQAHASANTQSVSQPPSPFLSGWGAESPMNMWGSQEHSTKKVGLVERLRRTRDMWADPVAGSASTSSPPPKSADAASPIGHRHRAPFTSSSSSSPSAYGDNGSSELCLSPASKSITFNVQPHVKARKRAHAAAQRERAQLKAAAAEAAAESKKYSTAELEKARIEAMRRVRDANKKKRAAAEKKEQAAEMTEEELKEHLAHIADMRRKAQERAAAHAQKVRSVINVFSCNSCQLHSEREIPSHA